MIEVGSGTAGIIPLSATVKIISPVPTSPPPKSNAKDDSLTSKKPAVNVNISLLLKIY